jgi:hypothetical protein
MKQIAILNTDQRHTRRLQVLGATLALCAFHGFSNGFFGAITVAATVIALLFPSFLTSPKFWLPILAAAIPSVVFYWYVIDNHKYLLFYWVIVVSLSSFIKEDSSFLKITGECARLLMLLTMAAAVLQKTISGSYLNGEMFSYLLLTDDRFFFWSKLFSCVTQQELIYNSEMLKQAGRAISNAQALEFQLKGWECVQPVAQYFTWINYLDQALLSLLVLFKRFDQSFFKHALIMLFIIGTYLVAPVYGFGWTLCIFGMCFTANQDNKNFNLYLYSLIILCAYEVFLWRLS